jgi:hypothetical protein
MERTFSSHDIANELIKKYGNDTRKIKITLYHGRAVNGFLQGVEKAHKKAAKSKLVFD